MSEGKMHAIGLAMDILIGAGMLGLLAVCFRLVLISALR